VAATAAKAASASAAKQKRLMLSPSEVKVLSSSGRLNVQSPVLKTYSSRKDKSVSTPFMRKSSSASTLISQVQTPLSAARIPNSAAEETLLTPTNPSSSNYIVPTPDQRFTAICNIDTEALPPGIGVAARGLSSLVMTQVHNGNLGRVIEKVRSAVSTVSNQLVSVGAVVGGRAAEAVNLHKYHTMYIKNAVAS